MSWSALGENPVPGEVDAVLRAASVLDGVCDQADLITSRLRVLDGGSGPQVWRGDAANAFRDLLAKIGPDLMKLSTSHHEAQQALRTYAGSLGTAQGQAHQAETDAERAVVDKNAADARRQLAANDAAGQEALARTAGLRILQAQTQRTAAPFDPAYQASMQQYQHQVGAQRANALAGAAKARSREAGEQSVANAATARLAAAKKLAHQASMLRDDAARTASRVINAAAAPGIAHHNVLERTLNAGSNKLRDITASPAFASWMNILSDVGEVLGDIGTILAFIPGMQGVAAGFIVAGAAFKGAAFLGTLVAGVYGHASAGQVLGRGLDFGLSVMSAGKALKAAKNLPKAANPVVQMAGKIKRSIWYDDARHATGAWRQVAAAPKLAGKAVGYLGHVGISPSTAFRLKTGYEAVQLGRRAWSAGSGLGQDVVGLRKDIRQFHDPAPQHTVPDEAAKTAKTATSTLVDVVAANTGHKGVPPEIVSKAAGFGAEKLTEEFVR